MILLCHLHYNPQKRLTKQTPFKQQRTSTLYPNDDGGEAIEMSNMNLDEIDVSPDEVPLLADFLDPDDQQKALDETNWLIQDKFPQADFSQIGPIGFGKKLENLGEIVSFGKGKGGKYGETRILKQGGRELLKKFTDKFKKALGPRAEDLIAQDNRDINEDRRKLTKYKQDLRKKEQQHDKLVQQTANNVQNLQRRLEATQAKIAALEEEPYLTLDQQNELDRLKQLKRNLNTDLENEKGKLRQLQVRKDKTLKPAQEAINNDKSKLSAKTKQRDEREVRLNRTKTLDELRRPKSSRRRQCCFKRKTSCNRSHR